MATTVVIQTGTPKKVTAGTLLFTKVFNVRMATIDTIDEDDISRRGAFTTGYSDIDAQAAKRPSCVWRTIAEMTELWHDGVEMELVNGIADAEKINRLVQEHLSDCTQYHQYQLTSLRREDPNITRRRLEELRQLDEFCRQIYNKVRTHGKDEDVVGLAKVLKSAGPMLGTNPFGQSPLASKRNASDYVPIEERIDYSVLKGKRRGRG